jgi:N-acetyl-anhydromuramyl-L-alanine amidase AmpD
MKALSIPAVEEQFLNTGNHGEYLLQNASYPLKDSDEIVNVVRVKPAQRTGYYYATAHKKQRIVLHFSGGNIRSDLAVLSRSDYHVSVSYVIGRDGTIYELFDSSFWSGHIGKGLGNVGTGNAQDKCTVGIELSNYGFLIPRKGQMETYYSRQPDSNGKPGPVDVYCSAAETEYYQKLEHEFRGHSYYATFHDKQYQSLEVLLRYLTSKHSIPFQFLDETRRYVATNEVLSFHGIVSHVNYRESGKWDLGPAFDWDRITRNAKVITPSPGVTANLGLTGRDETARTSKAVLPVSEEPEPVGDDITFSENVLKEVQSATKKKLYALLIGISDYPEGVYIGEDRVRFGPLHGADDVEKMAEYLMNETSFEVYLQDLTNEEATKPAIVAAFRKHLCNAGKDDSVLIYFSGHGTQEKADRILFKDETDGKLESLVCYYDADEAGFLLADKELRWLIEEVAVKEPHITAIFDCCHSAGITRNSLTALATDAIQKRVSYVFPNRKWEEFAFHDVIDRKTLEAGSEREILKEGIHIQMSACESDESAVEVAGEGVFTKTLLSVLKDAGGDVSYKDLHSRVRQYLRNIYEQKPRLYVAEVDNSDRSGYLESCFLNKAFNLNKNPVGEITYNELDGWQISRGAIHGMQKDARLVITDPSDKKISYSGVITNVMTDYSLLSISGGMPEENRIYFSRVDDFSTRKLKLFTTPAKGTSNDNLNVVLKMLYAGNRFLTIVEEEDKADYVLRYADDLYYLTLRKDPFRPLIEPVGNAAVLLKYLHHVSRWEFIRQLENSDDNILNIDKALEVEILSATPGEPSASLNLLEDGSVVLPLNFTDGKWRSSVQVRISNIADRNLYVGCLYLSADYRSFDGLLNPTVYLLGPAEEVYLSSKAGTTLTFDLYDHMRFYNWPAHVEHLKLVVSTEPFELDNLKLKQLPSPVVPGSAKKGQLRGGLTTEESTDADVHGWNTKTFKLRLQNPSPNTIARTDLDLMLRDERTTDFALGLFFELPLSLSRNYRLKEGITVTEHEEAAGLDEKGVIREKIIDVANYFARRKRNKRFSDSVKKFPSRLKIVSEGDSWFQHPLVPDIIDHLSRMYSIYCVAAAGDTLKNYVSGEKRNGEYYLDAINEHSPEIFLISGGGNDILGEQFRDFLEDKFTTAEEEGTKPERFLRVSINAAMDDLMNIYSALLKNLETEQPHLQVIIHGYDYPVKLNDAKKGWLGRYMIENKIDREADRRAIIRYIMDTFNSKLSETVKPFKNVRYLNVRNTVRYDVADKVDQWYDEIHPNGDGFQLVSMKFVEAITEIMSKKPIAH